MLWCLGDCTRPRWHLGACHIYMPLGMHTSSLREKLKLREGYLSKEWTRLTEQVESRSRSLSFLDHEETSSGSNCIESALPELRYPLVGDVINGIHVGHTPSLTAAEPGRSRNFSDIYSTVMHLLLEDTMGSEGRC